jgi:hypothetical protein
MQRMLQTRFPDLPIEILTTASSSGENAQRLLENHPLLNDFRPQLVLLNFANFEFGDKRLQEEIASFARPNPATKIAYLMSTSFGNESRMHPDARDFLDRSGILYLDPGPEIMHANNNTGFAWMDYLHLTSYGQRVAASAVAGRIAEAITGPPNHASPSRHAPEKPGLPL